MYYPEFTKLDTDATATFLEEIKKDLAPITVPVDKTIVQTTTVPFYEGYQFMALSDTTLPEPNTHYVMYKPGDLTVMNWTNEPLYALNERAPIKLDRKTVVPYAKFFFHYVRGVLGRFIIVEKPEEVEWLPNANDKEKEDVNSRIVPISYKGIGRDNLYTLSAIVVFKNALFRTDIKIAPYEMDVFDPESGEPEHFTIGQMKLTNEELLIEDLNVPIPPPPTDFG